MYGMYYVLVLIFSNTRKDTNFMKSNLFLPLHGEEYSLNKNYYVIKYETLKSLSKV